MFKRKILGTLLIAGSATPAALADDTGRFRQLSHSIRDRLPDSAEARAFYAAADKDQALDNFVETWLGEAGHEARIRRYFHDMFGIEPYVFLSEDTTDLLVYDPASHASAPSDLSTAGIYYLDAAVKPSCGGTPVTTTPWWSDTPVKICPSAISNAISYPGDIYCPDPFGANGLKNANCGCGPAEILCYPRAKKGKSINAVVHEFSERGWYSYANGLSWLELFGGDHFVGDRWLYQHYLYQERVVAKGENPTAAEMALLVSLPLDGRQVEAPFPVDGPERAGVVTEPAFLRRFNNFRSRIRAITERLLCKDVDGTLNTSGIATLVNPDLTAFDKAHGVRNNCKDCHLGMDNLGTLGLISWNADGYFIAYPAQLSQVGHAFGVDGTGPRFLMESYVLRAAGFNECMAKRAWEDFSGVPWDSLSDGDRVTFVTAAAEGPRSTIRTILTSDAMKNLRSSTVKPAAAASITRDFTTEIAPILENSCSGSACHSPGTARGPGSAYVGDDAKFKGAPVGRISSGSMPPAGSGKTLSDDDRAKLVQFLQQ